MGALCALQVKAYVEGEQITGFNTFLKGTKGKGQPEVIIIAKCEMCNFHKYELTSVSNKGKKCKLPKTGFCEMIGLINRPRDAKYYFKKKRCTCGLTTPCVFFEHENGNADEDGKCKCGICEKTLYPRLWNSWANVFNACKDSPHHCRKCGEVVCKDCSDQTRPFRVNNDPCYQGKKNLEVRERVCDECAENPKFVVADGWEIKSKRSRDPSRL